MLCVDGASGATRVVTVGRVKVERRQLVMVEVEAVVAEKKGDDDGTAESNKVSLACMAQNAETVRFVGERASGDDEDDGVVSVSVIEPGDEVVVCLLEGARHTGIKIEEQAWHER